MKKLFYLGIVVLIVFEILNVYFIMPMPGSQASNTVELAYALHRYRWLFRVLALVLMAVGLRAAFSGRHKWAPVLALILAGAVTWLFNFKMTAERMFREPQNLVLAPAAQNKLPGNSLVIGVTHNGQAKAYPIRFIAYHHQVRDVVGGNPVMVTYCSVCRTGRAFEPVVQGKPDQFRLVGMDHFNAMFEDAATGSWWQQATGMAVAGPLQGQALPEIPVTQMTVDKWYALHPDGLVMQPDPQFTSFYDTDGSYEQGLSTNSLTRTDSTAWQEKAWVIGVKAGTAHKAFDWSQLRQGRILHDSVGTTPVIVVLAQDGHSFAAFERGSGQLFVLRGDTIQSGNTAYNFSGRDLSNPQNNLRPLPAYQEFWHSWRTFQPLTAR